MNEEMNNGHEEVFSKKIRAGKRTYFFDVKSTRKSDFYIIITESKRNKYDENSFIKNKLYLYKEDFNKFSEALNETIGHVKSNLLPEYDFEEYARRGETNGAATSASGE